MKTAAIILLILLSSCYTKQKAVKQFSRSAVAYPEVAADYCGRVYPPIGTFIAGKEVYRIDTLFSDGELLILSDTATIKDTVIITKTKHIPTIIRGTVVKTDTVVKIDKADLDLCNIQLNSSLNLLAERNSEVNDWKAKAKKRFWINAGLVALSLFLLFLLIRKTDK